MTTDEVKTFIEDQTDIQVVQTIGRVLVLFKVSSKENLRQLSDQVARI